MSGMNRFASHSNETMGDCLNGSFPSFFENKQVKEYSPKWVRVSFCFRDCVLAGKNKPFGLQGSRREYGHFKGVPKAMTPESSGVSEPSLDGTSKSDRFNGKHQWEFSCLFFSFFFKWIQNGFGVAFGFPLKPQKRRHSHPDPG